ncbi:MAG: carboxy terminal-processing peptidase [Planctomycetales bacterium]|nr:carboxy terminal-processing peptidase [Planctomycetales bacterium]MBN8624591.1 carboxy terminal-processing peptidase [Planctomycetota bacterium]
MPGPAFYFPVEGRTPGQQHRRKGIVMTLRGFRLPRVLRSFVLAAALPAVVGSGLLLAELSGPTVQDRQITLAVTRYMREGHISRHELNDEIAERTLSNFLKTLDTQKVFFYQSDVDRFKAQEHDLDDLIRRGNTEFAFQVFNTYQARLEERMAWVDELLKQPFDFTVDEEITRDPDVAKYAVNEAEARDLWRKKIKYDLLVLKATEKLEGQEARDKLARRYSGLKKRMAQLKQDELIEWYLTAMTTSYDPHSTYMSPSTKENFEIQMRLNLQGIGAQLQYDDGYTVVHKVIPGGAADKDGRLKKKDRVVGVGQGADGEIRDVGDQSLNEVVDQIRGQKGTIVRLQVIPYGTTEKVIYNITRAQIELKEAEARSEIITEERNGKSQKIGFISLPSFYMDMEGARLGRPDYKSTTRDVAAILQKFRQEKVDAVVMDLRFNGGGSLTEAINLTGLFIDEGPVVQVKDKDNERQKYNDLDKGVAWDGPLVVLCNKFSASASEIFAGAIQDYNRGIIVGDPQTHGKGTVQSLLDLGRQIFQVPNAPELGALKLTMQQFYRPNGDSTQNQGVRSDVVLPSLTAELEVGESDLDFAMPFDKIESADYSRNDFVNPDMLDQLRAFSKGRIDSSTDFQKVKTRVTRYNEQKNRKTLPLNEEKFLAEVNADKEEGDLENEIEKEMNEQEDRPVVKKDYYFNEALNVTLDYIDLVKLAGARRLTLNVK